MQDDKFKKILKQHAENFSLDIDEKLFDSMMKKRSARRKKIRFIKFTLSSVASLAILVSVAVFFLKDNITQKYFSDQTVMFKPSSHDHGNTQSRINEALEKANKTQVGNAEQNYGSKENAEVHRSPDNRSGRDIEEKHSLQQKKNIAMKGSVIAAMENSKRRHAAISEIISSEQHFFQTQKSEQQNFEGHKNSYEKIGPASAIIDENRANNAFTVLRSSEEQLQKNIPASLNDSLEIIPPIITPADSVSPSIQKNIPQYADQKWNISLLFTPQLISRVYSANSSANLEWFNNYYHSTVINDKASFCYNAGFLVERKLGKSFGISSGILISEIKFQELKIIKGVATQSAQNRIFNDPAAIQTFDGNRYDISFTSLEFPLLMNYHIGTKKVALHFSTGIAYNYLVSTKSLVFDQSDTANVKETNDAGNNRLQQYRFILTAGIYGAYKINTWFSVYAGPVYSYSLNSLYNNNYVIRQNPYCIGLEAGLKFSF